MKRSLLLLAALIAALAFAAVGCGGSSGDVPSGAVAVVDGTEIPREELDSLIAQAKAGYEAQKQDFPQVGTPEYQSIQQQYVAFLVQKTEFEKEAEGLGVTVTDADVDKTREQLVKDRFDGDEKKLKAALEQQGLTEEAFLKTLRVSVLSDKIFQAVTKDVKVSDADALAFYTQNPDQYKTPASRQVRHILIAEKDSNGQVDFAKSKTEAERVHGMLEDGADFEDLVQRFSVDQGTKVNGGKYDAVQGASVPEFDAAAFKLKTDEISEPVKTQYGYHVIQALTDTKPEKVTPFEKAKAQIKASLVQQKKSEVAAAWAEDLRKKYEGKISYASGFAPPDLPDPTETDTETETQ